MQVRVNLTAVIAQAAGQIYDTEERTLLFLWLGRNQDREQPVEIDVPESAVQLAQSRSAPVRSDRKDQYAVRPLLQKALTSAIGVKWEVYDMAASGRSVALCYAETEARRICALLNRLDVDIDTKPL